MILTVAIEVISYIMRDRGYRRSMKNKKDKRLRQIIYRKGYCPNVGWIEYNLINGRWTETGKYIKPSSGSRKQKVLKRHSNKIVRKSAFSNKGNGYRKLCEYWWEIY